LSRKYFTDPRRYTSNKAAFVESALEKAAAWRSGQGQSIETERLCLLPLTAWQLKAGLDNPESLGRELGVAVPPAIFEDPVPRAIRMKLAKMAVADPAAHHWYTYWLIIIVRENVGAGLVGFKGAPDEQGEVEIGYGSAPAFQNQGYMTEAVQALVAWALKQPDCTAVTTWTDQSNQPSIRVLEKVGLTKIAEKDGRIFWRIAVDGS
jgi:RimJ/RimL family protein N-acetyltransferase